MNALAQAEKPLREWLVHARKCLAYMEAPADVTWTAQGQRESRLFDTGSNDRVFGAKPIPQVYTAKAAKVACHRDPQRWALLYRILWRIQSQHETYLLELAGDPDVRRFETLYRAVAQDIHRMKAFVRFQDVGDLDTGDVSLVAFYEPDHNILAWVVPHFRKRLGLVNWAILTPWASVTCRQEKFHFGTGVQASPRQCQDGVASLWCRYYRATHNPERTNTPLFDKTLPHRYRRHLTEMPAIEQLSTQERKAPSN